MGFVSTDQALHKGIIMLTYLSNDYCFAIYIDGELAHYGKHGDDPYYTLEALRNKSWNNCEFGKLKNFQIDGGAAPKFLVDARKPFWCD
jgi:hypothetical protein